MLRTDIIWQSLLSNHIQESPHLCPEMVRYLYLLRGSVTEQGRRFPPKGLRGQSTRRAHGEPGEPDRKGELIDSHIIFKGDECDNLLVCADSIQQVKMATMAPTKRCIRAMSHVYGDFESLPENDCKTWTPPPGPTESHGGRRLWTDAFGVINFTSLFLETTDKRYLWLAERLAQTVHDVLGRSRNGLHRLPGASDKKPLLGGLRSGRAEEKEDGQVHRELTMWMFALDRLGRASRDETWQNLAVELGEAVHPRFTVHKLSGGMRLVGKISGDMEDVVEVKRGELDAVLGWAVYRLIRRGVGGGKVLLREVDEYERVMGSEAGVVAGEEDLEWLGLGLWVSGLWKGENWSEEMGRLGLKRVGEVFRGVKEVLDESEDVEEKAVGELGACLGVRCWIDEKTEKEEEEELLEASERVVRVWEKRVESAEILKADMRGLVSVMVGAVVLSQGKWFS